VLLWLVPGLSRVLAADVQPVPALTARVMDTTQTLDHTRRAELEQRLATLEQTHGTQLVVLLVQTTAPEDIAAYANRVGNTWKIGRREEGDGLLLVVALQDRRLRLEVAKALEGAIPDLAAKGILDDVITPRFRAGDVPGGLIAAVDRVDALVSGQLPAPPAATEAAVAVRAGISVDWFDLAIFLFVAVPLSGAVLKAILGHKIGSLANGVALGAAALFITDNLWLAVIAGLIALFVALFDKGKSGLPRLGATDSARTGTFGGGWDWGGSGSSGSSGSFGSGGGGDFGGGGASGDW